VWQNISHINDVAREKCQKDARRPNAKAFPDEAGTLECFSITC